MLTKSNTVNLPFHAKLLSVNPSTQAMTFYDDIHVRYFN